eukprot:TRINITY_DN2050_c0_g1_i1.p1 TRINITY_DN2050_c0_g1~~TRINITY_DN2050_c0_g1_i1.p1  ORF type:complete len:142 (-),score=1.30 TRINITY_DN2050_c0_g1_i1:110-535(-)
MVLVNIKETVSRGVLFPPKPIWEDIEFNHLCHENGLLVYRCDRFFHEKLNMQLLPASPVVPAWLEWNENIPLVRPNAQPETFDLHGALKTQLNGRSSDIWIGPHLMVGQATKVQIPGEPELSLRSEVAIFILPPSTETYLR